MKFSERERSILRRGRRHRLRVIADFRTKLRGNRFVLKIGVAGDQIADPLESEKL
jgi:hypothetical protein